MIFSFTWSRMMRLSPRRSSKGVGVGGWGEWGGVEKGKCSALVQIVILVGSGVGLFHFVAFALNQNKVVANKKEVGKCRLAEARASKDCKQKELERGGGRLWRWCCGRISFEFDASFSF